MTLSAFTVTIITKTDSPDNVLPNAPLEIRNRLANGTSGTLAAIFLEAAGTTPITQPGAVTDSLGQFTFYAAAAPYNAVFDNNGTPVISAIDTGITAVVAEEIKGLLIKTTAESKLLTFSEGDNVIISDRKNHRFKFQDSRQLISGESATLMTFDDEIHILVNAGGMLVFDELDKLATLESENYAKYVAKVRGRTDIVIKDAYGDSITFAQANPSDPGSTNRIGDATNFGDGSVYAHWQFDNSYPVRLEETLDAALTSGGTVSNRGFSGDTVVKGYLRHRVVTTADVSLIMYGINETLNATSNGSIPGGIVSNSLFNVFNFAKILYLFCTREILRGKAVIVMGTTPFESLVGYDGSNLSSTKLSTAYSDAAQSVAESLNLKYIDTRSDIFRQYSNIFNDGTHLNDDGLKILGFRMAAPLIGGGYKNDYRIKEGDVLLAHELQSRIQSIGALQILPNVSSSTPFLKNSEPSTIQLILGAPARNVYIPFYAESDNLVIYPTLLISGTTTLDILLDAGALNPINMASFPLGLPASRPTNAKSVTVTQFKNRSNTNFSDSTDPHIHVPNRGWHFLLIRNTGAQVNSFLDSLVIDSVTNVLERDVNGGVSSLVNFDTGPISVNKEKNMDAPTSSGTGVFSFTFTEQLANLTYQVLAEPIGGANINVFKVSNKTTSGFDLTFTEAPGIGVGISWALYDPTTITVRTIGGR